MRPYQSEDPSPAIPTYRNKEEKGKTVEDKMEATSISQYKCIDHALNALHSHTIKYRMSKIVLQRYSEGNESPACGSARFCSEQTHKYTDVRSKHRV